MKVPRILGVLGKVIASGLLAAVFIALFIKAPFLSQREGLILPGNSGQFSAAEVNTGAPPEGELQLGLFSGSFAKTSVAPAFSMEEKSVDGACEGAGYRYIAQVCPDCPPVSGMSPTGQVSALTWTEQTDEGDALYSVGRDCIDVDENGNAIVGVLTFGTGSSMVSASTVDLANDKVPLVPGATRLSALEMGGWMAIMDEVDDPEHALEDMASALRSLGWSDAPGQQDALQGVEGISAQKVFTGKNQSTCVIYLNEAGGTTQLVTIMSS